MDTFPDSQEDEELSSLLSRLDKPTLSASRQQILKMEIIRRISTDRQPEVALGWADKLAFVFGKIGREVKLSFFSKLFIREKVFAFVRNEEREVSRGKVFISVFAPWARGFAGVTLAVFLTFLISSVFVAPAVVEASSVTQVADFEGTVEVVRAGQAMPVAKGLELKPRDIIHTGDNSKVTVHFMDDSVARLAANTTVSIEQLFANPFDPTKTLVEVKLSVGTLWAQVISIVDRFSSFRVRTDDAVLTAQERAAFNVSVQEGGKTEVTAVQYSVDVTVGKPTQQTVSTTLAGGYKMEVAAANTKIERAPVDKGADGEQWIIANIIEDEARIQELKKQYREELRKKADEKVMSGLFALDEYSKQRAKIRAAEAKLAQAQILMDGNFDQDAREVLSEFSGLVKEISAASEALSAQDPVEATELRDELRQTIQSYKKQFALLLPDDVFYELKGAIADADLSLAKTPAEAVGKKLEQASEKLIEAQTMAKQGKTDYAAMTVQDFKDTVSSVAKETSQLDPAKKDEVAPVILEEKTNQLRLLKVLSTEVEYTKPPVLQPGESRSISLQEIIQNVKQESIDELNQAVGVAPEETQQAASATGASADTTSVKDPSESESGTWEIGSDGLSGVTVITIEARPSEPVTIPQETETAPQPEPAPAPAQ